MSVLSLFNIRFLLILFSTASIAFARDQLLESNIKKNEQAIPEYNQALSLYRDGELDRAVTAFKNLINLYPEIPKSYTKLIQIYREQRKLQEANDYFKSLNKSGNPFVHHALGIIEMKLNNYPKAIEYFQKAIQLSPSFASGYSAISEAYIKAQNFEHGLSWLTKWASHNPDHAAVWYGIANMSSLKSNWEKAFENIHESLELDSAFVPALLLKTKSLRNTGEMDHAMSTCKKTIQFAEQQNDPDGKLKALILKGTIHWYLGQYQEATALSEEALALAQKLVENEIEAGILNNLGTFYRGMGKFQEAMAILKRSLAVNQQLGFVHGMGLALGNIGDVFVQISDYDSALVYYERALIIAKESGDKRLHADILSSIGVAFSYMGEYETANENSKKALSLYQEIDDRNGRANELTNMGIAHIELGNYTKALDLLNSANAIAKEIDDSYLQHIQLDNMGHVFHFLGDFKRALKHHRQALDIAVQNEDKDSEAICLMNIGRIELETHKLDSAAIHLNKALEICTNNGDKRGQGIAYANLAYIKAQQNQFENSIALYEKSLSIAREIGNRFGEGETLNELGMLWQKVDEDAKAIEHHQKALSIGENLAAAKIKWEASWGLGSAFHKQGNLEKAKGFYEAAIENIEKTRWQLGLSEFKSSFFADKIEVYQKLVGLCLDLQNSQPIENLGLLAFHYVERAKARSLLDLLTEAKLKIASDLDPALIKRQDKIFHTIAKIQTELRNPVISETRRQELLDKVSNEEEALQRAQMDIKKSNSAYWKFHNPELVTLDQIQENLLDKETVLLEFFIIDQHYYLWAITKDQHKVIRLASRKEIDNLVGSYLRIISHPPHPGLLPYKTGKTLFQELIKPAENFLSLKQKVIIVPEGILNALPFETLIDQMNGMTPHYWVESVDIRYAQSSSVLSFLESKSSKPVQSALLAFGNPRFGSADEEYIPNRDNSQVSERGIYLERGFVFPNLPYTETEVQKIASLFPANEADVYLGTEVCEDQIKKLNLDNFRFIHFATHGVIDEEKPARSCIVLTLDDDPAEDGFLQMQEIFNLKLNADLVVLSACQTGRGKLIGGEGMISLTRGFQYAGANSVIVSLWSVNDQSTVDFMESFYRAIKEGDAFDVALRHAKRKMLQNKNRALQHPYYWAPFVLIGPK
ncbi:MAG: CHAT domain-containing protein [Candidatus Lokiarchaeota archaeon]|nr:CHAT domain-containing protein [Candidatus Lokiarchaeota archaeon]